MKKIKLPNPVVMIFGSMGAFWIADIVNPGFNPVGVMILFLIPVLIVDFLYPQPELAQLVESALTTPIEEPAPEQPVSGELLEDEIPAENT
ncbi:MAG: hypothetical protein ACKE51_06625 [Methylococcaceae bacterium]